MPAVGILRFTISRVLAMFGRPKNIAMPAKFRPQFDVDQFIQYTTDLGEEAAEEFLQLLISNIEKNKFKYKLTDEVIKRKGTDRPWIETGELLRSIIRTGTKVSPIKGKHSSGLTYAQLAIIQEYGLKDLGIPPRDFFRRTFQEFEPIYRKKMAQRFKNGRKSKGKKPIK